MAGIARVACAAAIAIVCPPYTSRRPCELPVASVWAMASVQRQPSQLRRGGHGLAGLHSEGLPGARSP